MQYAQRVGKYMRLRQELAAASRSQTTEDPSYLSRLRLEIAALERAMALPVPVAANPFLPTEPGR